MRNTSAYFTSCLVVKGQAKINTSIQLKLKVIMGVYAIFLANAELVCGIIKHFKIQMRNHRENYFLINVACRSDANMIEWQRAAIFEF